MKFYRQGDYPNIQLGEYGKITMATAGCFVVSLANLANIDPVEVNTLLAKNKCFVQGNMLFDKAKTAKLLGLEYSGRTTKKPDYICIAETHDTKAPQHFFVYDPETGKMNDPLSKKRDWEKCKYKIVSYRLFVGPYEKNETASMKEIEAKKKAEKKMYDDIDKGISSLSQKEILENILKNQKELFSEISKIKDTKTNKEEQEHLQDLLVLVASTGSLVREGQKNLGLEISK